MSRAFGEVFIGRMPVARTAVFAAQKRRILLLWWVGDHHDRWSALLGHGVPPAEAMIGTAGDHDFGFKMV